MSRSPNLFAERLYWFGWTAIGYFILAGLSLYATKGADNIAAIWPPSGFFLAMLILMPARSWLAGIAGMAAASFSANGLAGATVLTSAIFTLANGVEAGFALWLLRKREPELMSFMVPRSVGNFCIAALSASVISAGIATGLTGSGSGFFLSWLTTVALGMLIVTPPVVMLVRLFSSGALDSVPSVTKAESVAILTAAAAITAASFSQSMMPVTFLPCVAVFAAAYRLGPFGAAAGLLVVAIVSSLLTGQGEGPIAMIDGGGKLSVFFLQFYLVTMLFTALPLAALLVVHKRLARRLERSNHLLLQAEAAALVGHWRVDLNRWTIQWSDQSYRIHGIEPGDHVSVQSSLGYYVVEDQEKVNATIEEALRTGEPFQFQGRINRPDGAVRHVQSHGSIELGRNGKPIAIFGTIQDITQNVENARVLETARLDAERAANTDSLTGLPNRRHTLSFLAEALDRAQSTGAPLAVAIFDIDHFKSVNDKFGHAVGDKVIRRIGLRAKAVLRKGDMVGRFGGEEYVCILQGSSAKSAELVAERVRKSIETENRVQDGPAKVTVSIGLAVYRGETNIEELLQRADQALYRAKREGRNRLRMAA